MWPGMLRTDGGSVRSRASPASACPSLLLDPVAQSDSERGEAEAAPVQMTGVTVTSCELPPGWVFDSSSLKSRPVLDGEHVQKVENVNAVPTGSTEDDLSHEVDGFETLLGEALHLRNQGHQLDPVERRARASAVALKLAEFI